MIYIYRGGAHLEDVDLKELSEEVRLLREEIRLLRMQLRPENLQKDQKKTAPDLVKEEEAPILITEKENVSSSAVRYLSSKKITVKNYSAGTEDTIQTKLSHYLGSRYSSLKELYNVIKPSLSTGGTFYYNMQNKSQDVIAYCTQFCNMLHQNAFLTSYSYKKAAKTITGMPQRVGMVINFFTGGWLENYVFHFLNETVKSKGIKDFSFVQNCQIELLNGDDFEMDMASIINDTPIWIECKTGDYQRYILKYADFRKKLGTSVENSILIISDLPDGVGKNLSSTFQLKICNLEEGKKYIEELVSKLSNNKRNG
jgi:hypothetical protein